MPKTSVRGYVDERLIEEAIKQWPDLALVSGTSAKIDFVFRKLLDLAASTEPTRTESTPVAPTMKTITLAPKIGPEPEGRRWTPAEAKERFGLLRPGP